MTSLGYWGLRWLGFCFVLGPQLLCAQDHTYEVLGIEPGSAICKAKHPTDYTIALAPGLVGFDTFAPRACGGNLKEH